jgi:hypothetical protein
MNKYPVWWDTTITIYNKHENPETGVITWYHHTISNCFWKYTGNKIAFSNYYSANNSMVLETNDTICRIPINEIYTPNYTWINIPNDQKGNYFTLKLGDIIVKGEVDDEINEYQSGHRSTDLVAKYKALQGCIEITKFSENIGNGRVNEHYYVKGV